MFGEPLEVKGRTKLECVHNCQAREGMYDYVTKIHEVTVFKKDYEFNGNKAMFAGVFHDKYYRAFMRLKPKGEEHA